MRYTSEDISNINIAERIHFNHLTDKKTVSVVMFCVISQKKQELQSNSEKPCKLDHEEYEEKEVGQRVFSNSRSGLQGQ